MIDTLTIDEVVRRTGLTSRALRFYEARGLIRPLRTARGRRLFGAGELARVHEIIALKKAGLSLAQIKCLLDRRIFDLAALLGEQIACIDAQTRELNGVRATLHSALSRIEGGEPLDVATLCSLLREGEKVINERDKWKKVIDRYYSAEQQGHWADKETKPHPEGAFDQAAYAAKWRELSNRIEAAMPMDPGGAQALGFVREWFALLEPFTSVATPEMWQRLKCGKARSTSMTRGPSGKGRRIPIFRPKYGDLSAKPPPPTVPLATMSGPFPHL